MLFTQTALSLATLSVALGGAVVQHPKNPLIPGQFKSLKEIQHTNASPKQISVAGVNATATGYLVANMFFGSPECSSKQSGVYATATGVCFLGVDSSGASVGSLVYTFGGVGANGVIQLYTSVFQSYDCSGDYNTSAGALPTSCFSDDENTNGYVYTYTSSSEPWANYEPGLLFQYYGNENQCGGVGGMYGWYGLGTCLPATTDDGSEISIAFTQCSGGVYTQTLFTDSHCQDWSQAVSSKLMDCQESSDTSNDDFSPSKAYESFFCTAE